MTATEIFEEVRKIITERFDVAPDAVTMDSHFSEDLGADSLDNVELVMAFEERFDLEIPDEEADKIETVRHAVDYIAKHVAA